MFKIKANLKVWPLLFISLIVFLLVAALSLNGLQPYGALSADLAASMPSIIIPEGYDLSSIPNNETIDLNTLSAEEYLYVGEGQAKYYIVTGSTQHANLVFSGDTVILLYNASFHLESGSAIKLSTSDTLTVVIAKKSVNSLITYEENYAALTAQEGNLKIYSEEVDPKDSEYVGYLFAQGGLGAAAIGASNYSAIGNIEIYGGRIQAFSPQLVGGMVQNNSAAIGASEKFSVGNIYIENAEVTAESTCGAGIGAGMEGLVGEINIQSSKIDATGRYNAAIGAGDLATAASITITDSEISVQTYMSAGIGAGFSAGADVLGDIRLTNNQIKAEMLFDPNSGDNGGAAIGAGFRAAVLGDIYIEDCEITAFSKGSAAIGGGNSETAVVQSIYIINCDIQATGVMGAAIGGGYRGAVLGPIEITGGNVCVEGDNGGAGIGGGYHASASVDAIKIQNVAVKAIGGSGSGIGGGYQGAIVNSIEITGGTVYAEGKSGGAGIGGGFAVTASVDTIIIQRATINALGSTGAGIGSGFDGAVLNSIEITGGMIDAYGFSGAGIGAGRRCDVGGSIIIKDANITANGEYGAGIGGGNVGEVFGDIEIEGGTVYAKGTGAGIGGGDFYQNDAPATAVGSIKIQYAVIEAYGEYGAGIGGGYISAVLGDIEIIDSHVFAVSYSEYLEYGAGIGGGVLSTLTGDIKITGGEIYAVGKVGIGNGYGTFEDDSTIGLILIQDAYIEAIGQEGVGIGSGQDSVNATVAEIKIEGGEIFAYSLEYAAISADSVSVTADAQVRVFSGNDDLPAIENYQGDAYLLQIIFDRQGRDEDVIFNGVSSDASDFFQINLPQQFNSFSYTAKNGTYQLSTILNGKLYKLIDQDAMQYDIESGNGDVFYTIRIAEVYTVILELDGGFINNDDRAVIKIEVNEKEGIYLPVPEKSGYAFMGWTVGNETYFGYIPSVEDNMTLKAKYGKFYFTLTLDIEGTETAYKVQADEEFMLFVPSVESKTFLHWEDEDKNQFDGNMNFKVEKDVTLYAVFEESYFTLILEIEGKIYEYPVQRDEEFLLFLPSADGKTFLYWEDEDKNEYQGNTKYKVEDDATLYAVFENSYYMLTLYIERAETEYTVQVGEEFMLFAPNVDGKTFLYWEDADKKQYDGNTNFKVEKDMTLYAVFEDDNRVELREFSLEINLNNGTGAILTYKVPENEAFTLGAPAERKGYKFVGWISDDDIYYSADMQTIYVRANMTLTAQWEKDTLSLVWLYVMVGGLAVLTVTVFIAFLNVRYIKKKKMDELE